MSKKKVEPDIKLVEHGFQLVLNGLGIPTTAHTRDTARRAAHAWWKEICVGAVTPPPRVTTFPSQVDEMVMLRDIPIFSVCSHHLLPFVGTATIAYLSGNGKILGLSKLSRLADYYARRPQVQEELTDQIADAVAQHVMGKKRGGVGVVVRANHMCMAMRGVKHQGDMLTSALRGVFKKPEVRDEFLRLAGF